MLLYFSSLPFFPLSVAAATKWLLFSFLISTRKQTKQNEKRRRKSNAINRHQCRRQVMNVNERMFNSTALSLDVGVPTKYRTEKIRSNFFIVNAPEKNSHSTKCRAIIFYSQIYFDTFFCCLFFCFFSREAHRHHMFMFLLLLFFSSPPRNKNVLANKHDI